MSKELDTVLAQNQKGLAVKKARTFNMLKVFFGLIMVLGVFTWLKSCSWEEMLSSPSNTLVTTYEATEEEFEFRWILSDDDQIEVGMDELVDRYEDEEAYCFLWIAVAVDKLKLGTGTGLGSENFKVLMDAYRLPTNLTLYVSSLGQESTAIYHDSQVVSLLHSSPIC